MGKFTCSLAIKFYDISDTERTQQLRDDNTAYRIYRIDSHCKISFTDSLDIDKSKILDCFNMMQDISIVKIFFPQLHHTDKLIVILISDTNDLFSFGIIKKLSMLVKKFKSVPLDGIMTCRNDNTSTCFFGSDGKFCSRSRGQTYVYHVKSHGHKRADHKMRNHMAGNTRVTSDYNRIARSLI